MTSIVSTSPTASRPKGDAMLSDLEDVLSNSFVFTVGPDTELGDAGGFHPPGRRIASGTALWS
jgi:hypothetical protein